MKKTSDLLQDYLKRKQQTLPSYSMRALARDLQVSPSFVSDIFSGAKAVPLARIPDLSKRLGLDEVSEALLRRAVLVEQLPLEERKNLTPSEGLQFLSQFKEENIQNVHLFRHWYHIAILDLATCADFSADVMWISRKLGIKTQEASQALYFLTTAEFLIEKNGRLQKANELLRTPTLKSHEAIRNFHKQLMIKAIDTMMSETTEEDFSKRWISGIMMAANPERIAEAKIRLNLALHEIAAFVSEGDCSEVYQLGVQFFPVTKKSSQT